MLGVVWEVWHSVASRTAAGTGVQASGRVYVPGDAQEPVAAASQSYPLRLPKRTDLDTGTAHSVSHFTLLIRSLTSKTLVVGGDLHEPVSQLSVRLSLVTGVPRRH